MTTPSLPDALRACIEAANMVFGTADEPMATGAAYRCAALIRQHGPALEALLRERELHQQADAWMPIESAPKDGTPVLLISSGSNPHIARWSEDCEHGNGEPSSPGWQIHECDDAWYSVSFDDPTHWMPLPAGPNGAAREGMGRDGTSVMNVDEALAYADDNSPLPFKTVNTWKCVLTLADEVHSLREQNRRLRFYQEFGSDGKPFCRRSWNEGREAGIAAVAEAKESLQPDMEALRRENVELVEILKHARRELDACQSVIHLAGGFDPAYITGAKAVIKEIDAAQRDTSEGGE